jgi:hypothetical protein
MLTPEEYQRRQEFGEVIKGMTKSECIEIARILRKHGITLSENRSGLFFDLTKISEEAFEEMLQFRTFILKNNTELSKRDTELKAPARK